MILLSGLSFIIEKYDVQYMYINRYSAIKFLQCDVFDKKELKQ